MQGVLREEFILGIAGFCALFMIVIPISVHITYRIFGGGYVTFGSWISMALVSSVLTGAGILGEYTGIKGWIIIPAFVVMLLVARVCAWLELHDGWTPEKPFDLLLVKRSFVGLLFGAVVTTFLAGFMPGFFPYPLPVEFSLWVAAGTFAMSGMMVGGLGFMKWRDDEIAREARNRRPLEHMLKRLNEAASHHQEN